ncbi:acetyl esterase family enzyme [Liquorilactobacillus sucicola DSM 21376 = JCM 15457]|uniref:Xylan esterase n=1 Tax=Liquorilactobacillus sucicola DSM 21376 = JCM 15457 TaxID=1423806 RepID=A0A023CVI9_9LACO|nr:alpha/beta hydrolase [Liquorilactobacillus sucicola]KRN05524.1 xylan esterase [Liquorilactobacillus sucicola DSM 21376 = JCM 15457]GAJ25606.1 acetyl esterase family enzyme [Liquorilactobacillus sucicola DSM 21376 = JCM 15457]
MKLEKKFLWSNGSKANYCAYLMDNSVDIELKRKHPAIIICGGGGFARITSREQEPAAFYFLNQGYQVFVLNYTTKSTGDGSYPNPLFDLAKMIATVRTRALEWNIDPKKIAILGFSAGGAVCGSLATEWQKTYLSEKIGISSSMLRPDAVILSYPLLDFVYQRKMLKVDKNREKILPLVNMQKNSFLSKALETGIGKEATIAQLETASPISHITKHVPPFFLWGTSDDEMMYTGQLLNFAKKLSDLGLNYELHIFENGQHGLSLANYNSMPDGSEKNISIWGKLALKFLQKHL